MKDQYRRAADLLANAVSAYIVEQLYLDHVNPKTHEAMCSALTHYCDVTSHRPPPRKAPDS